MADVTDETRGSARRRRMSRGQVVGAVAVAVVLVGAVATVLIVRFGSSDGRRRVAPAPSSTSTTSSVGPSTSAPAVSVSTTTATTTPAPSSRRLYPAYLPTGVGQGALWIYADPEMDSGYTQSYYGANAAELVIGERLARVGGGDPSVPARFAGRDVLMWHSPDSHNPVIVVTAKAQSIDKILGLHIAKVDDYVTKPFGPQELLQSVERVLSAKAQAAS